MDQQRLQQRLMSAFVAELEEHVAALNRDALALEQPAGSAERDEILRRLFRTAHTVKSAARAAGVTPLEAAAHQLEDLLAAVRDGASEVDDALLAVLFDSADALDDVRGRLAAGSPLDDSPLAALLPRVDALARGLPVPPAAAPLRRSQSRAVVPDGASPPPAPEAIRACPICGSAHHAGATCPPADRDAARSTSDGAAVRLAPAKLDALLATAGELHAAIGGLAQRLRELDGLCDHVAARRHSLGETGGAGDRREEFAHAARGADGELERELERVTSRLFAQHHDLERLVAPLLSAVRHLRMIPFAEACQGFDRLVRDLSHRFGKEVRLRVEGGDVELDRAVLDELKDPLRHLVRNAVDHGLEGPAERTRAGKPALGEVRVGASVQGARVVITVDDDGRGIDRTAVATEAARRGLSVPSDDAGLFALLFRAGFSTAREVTEVSGRGVGLDVVRARIDAVQGDVAIASEPGRGARFTLQVPLTLSTLRAVLFRIGQGTYALPSVAVAGLTEVARDLVVSVEGREAVPWQGRHVPLIHAASCLGVQADPVGVAADLSLVVVEAADRALAFAVDELLTEEEITIRPLGPRLCNLPGVGGASLLPDGRVAVLLGAAALHRAALEVGSTPSLAAPREQDARRRRRVLLVEDSLTTRTLETMILEAAGYEVVSAVDGRDALDRIGGLDVDLVVSDVQMPRLDGVTLTRALRALPRYAALPVVLVTGMASDDDRRRGLEAGADAYLVKSAFDQAELLATIASLL